MKQTLREFAGLFLRKGWLWISNAFAILGILGAINSYTFNFLSDRFQIESWVWFLIIIICLLISSIFVFHQKRVEYDNLNNELVEIETTERILNELATYREDGVILRNDGSRLIEQTEIEKWWKDATKWEEDVRAKIAELSLPEATIYKILDWVDFPIQPFLEPHIGHLKIVEGKAILERATAEHINHLRIHSQRLRSLRELVLRYSRETTLRKTRRST